jgi:hypothetical protein
MDKENPRSPKRKIRNLLTIYQTAEVIADLTGKTPKNPSITEQITNAITALPSLTPLTTEDTTQATRA